MKAGWQRWMILGCLVLTSGAAMAQGRGPGGGMGGQRGGSAAMPQGSSFPGPSPNVRTVPPGTGSPGATSTMRGGLQLGPPGRWWDDKNFAMALGLRRDQQQKMDNIFNANKGAILDSYKNLQKQESLLEATTRESKLDEQRIFAAIDAVNQARSALEKANAHMLLMVRQAMDAEQIKNMEKLREKPADE